MRDGVGDQMAKPKLNDAQWAEIELRWATGQTSSLLAREFSVTRQIIDRRAKREKWTRSLAHDVEERTTEKLLGLSPGASPEEKAAAVELASDGRVQLVQNHRAAWVNIHAMRDEAHRILWLNGNPRLVDFKTHRKSDAENGIERGDVVMRAGRPVKQEVTILPLLDRINIANKLLTMFQKDGEALQAVQEGERRAHGFDYKMQQEDEKKRNEGHKARLESFQKLAEAVDKAKKLLPPPEVEDDNIATEEEGPTDDKLIDPAPDAD